MYFETGQGSALSAGAHHGVDQLTLEARAYGVARAFDPFLVNSVVGFIGPEYLSDERQIIRAGLEDHFMGKLLGLPMGCDVCYTNHADADQNSADNLLLLLAAAGCNFVMGVPCADDVMLNYQSTSYHDVAGVRGLLGRTAAPEFQAWLERRGIVQGRGLPRGRRPRSPSNWSGRSGRSSMAGLERWTTPPNESLPDLIDLVRQRTPARLLVGRAGSSVSDRDLNSISARTTPPRWTRSARRWTWLRLRPRIRRALGALRSSVAGDAARPNTCSDPTSADGSTTASTDLIRRDSARKGSTSRSRSATGSRRPPSPPRSRPLLPLLERGAVDRAGASVDRSRSAIVGSAS